MHLLCLEFITSQGVTFKTSRHINMSYRPLRKIKNQFGDFFHNEEVFSLGVCNGCQALSLLKPLIPGKIWWEYWTGGRLPPGLDGPAQPAKSTWVELDIG